MLHSVSAGLDIKLLHIPRFIVDEEKTKRNKNKECALLDPA
jgi:hypothetical protein